MRSKWNIQELVLSLFLFLLLVSGLAAGDNPTHTPTPTDDETPIKITFQNTSSQPVIVHVLSFDVAESTHNLEPGKTLEIAVENGRNVRLQYQPNPRQTLLGPMGSLNELFRTVTIRDDGDHLFITEKYSGQRGKRKGGKLRPKQDVVSPQPQPQLPRPPRKADPTQPEQKEKITPSSKSHKQSGINGKGTSRKNTLPFSPSNPDTSLMDDMEKNQIVRTPKGKQKIPTDLTTSGKPTRKRRPHQTGK